MQSEQVTAVEEQGARLQQASCLLSFWVSQGFTRRHSQSRRSSLPVSSSSRGEEVACGLQLSESFCSSPPILRVPTGFHFV